MATQPLTFNLLQLSTHAPNLLFIRTSWSTQSFHTMNIILLLLTEQIEINQV